MNLHHLEIFLAVCHAGSLQGAADKLGISRQAVSKAINALESSLGTAHMNLHHLEIFLAVCHAGSLQGAADKLGISRQAVSKAINALESSLGTALFIREARGITLTTTTYVFKEHAQKVAIELAAIRKLRNIELLPRRPLMIYSLDHVFSYIGSDFMVEFANQEKQITLSVVESTDENALLALEAGKCELAIVYGPFDEERFEAIPLFDTQYTVRMLATHPLATKELLTPQDLLGQKIIGKGRSYSCFTKSFDEILSKYQEEVDIIAETSDEALLTDQDLLGQKIIGKGRSYSCFTKSFDEILSKYQEEVDIIAETSDEALLTELILKTNALAVGFDYSYQLDNTLIVEKPFAKTPHNTKVTICLVKRRGTVATYAASAFEHSLINYLATKHS